jgi:hypothetical protein
MSHPIYQHPTYFNFKGKAICIIPQKLKNYFDRGKNKGYLSSVTFNYGIGTSFLRKSQKTEK